MALVGQLLMRDVTEASIMLVESGISATRRHQTRTGRLLLNDIDVGGVVLRGQDGSWHFGEFTPAEAFGEFAPIFGAWSLMMHADGPERLSAASADELRSIEMEIDCIRAAIRLDAPTEHRQLRQINIDGSLIEWKE